MLAVIAKLNVKDDKGAEFEKVMLDLAEKVTTNEPGNHLYQLCNLVANEDDILVTIFYAFCQSSFRFKKSIWKSFYSCFVLLSSICSRVFSKDADPIHK